MQTALLPSRTGLKRNDWKMMEQGILPLIGSTPRKYADARDLIDLSRFTHQISPEYFELAGGILNAFQIKISHLYDKLGCLSNSRTRLLPHQIEATHIVVNALRPRFLLADEVGLGKTIEAGLIMKELVLRKGMKRILVCVPAPLGVQWQQEMRSKFNEEFTILNRANFYQIAENWNRHTRIITSIDFIKNPRYADDVLRMRWDIVVFDEAHRLRRDYNKITKAYAFAERISHKCDALLLLSATPFRGKIEELYYLVHLLDPHLLGPHNSFIQEYVLPEKKGDGTNSRLSDLKTRIGRVMLRRRKVDVGGFTKRHACTIRFNLSEVERALYDETTDYVKREYNLAMREKNRAVSFVMIVFQKLLDSSTHALLRAMERRKLMLEQRMFGMSQVARAEGELPAEFDFEEFLDESETPEDLMGDIEGDQICSLKDTRREIMTVNHLIQLARRVGEDRKLIKLKDTLLRLRREGSKKFIIFTQFRTTQDYLAEKLSNEFTVTIFHGSQNWREKEEAIEEFRDHSDVLILTEAGGEGRNLQFTNILINYDLPWSPLKIEQRIGRVHRFGQAHDVYIFNFATRDTVAERVLEVLTEKINLFKECIGTPDILLGTMEDEGEFQQSFMQFISGKKTRAELNAELEAKQKIAESGYRKLNDLVTPHCVDFNLNDYYEFTRENRQVDNHRLEEITLRYLRSNPSSKFQLIGNVQIIKKSKPSPRFASADMSPCYILQTAEAGRRPATFDSSKALENSDWEFLALGHPLVEEALGFFMTHSERNLILPAGSLGKRSPGYYFIFFCKYEGGMDRAELMAAYVRVDLSTRVEIFISDLPARPAPRNKRAQKDTVDSESTMELQHALQKAMQGLQPEAEKQATRLCENLHSIFKKEEYKIDISYGKKLRQLEEKRDRQRLRHRLLPNKQNQAQLTRTENEILNARQEREVRLYKVRRDSEIKPVLELIQVYNCNL